MAAALSKGESQVTKGARPLERYMQMLEVIAAGRGNVSPAALAAALGLPRTTTYRLLKGLIDSDLVAAEGDGGYRLTDRLIRLLSLGRSSADTEILAGEPLRLLSEATGLTSYLSRLAGVAVHSVAMRTPDELSGIYVVPGADLPIHATAAGKAIMAFQPDDVIAAALAPPLARLTKRTVIDKRALRAEYAQVRQRGYATCYSEDVEGFAAIACPIHLDRAGVIFSVGVTGTTAALGKAALAARVSALRSAAERLAAILAVIAD